MNCNYSLCFSGGSNFCCCLSECTLLCLQVTIISIVVAVNSFTLHDVILGRRHDRYDPYFDIAESLKIGPNVPFAIN